MISEKQVFIACCDGCGIEHDDTEVIWYYSSVREALDAVESAEWLVVTDRDDPAYGEWCPNCIDDLPDRPRVYENDPDQIEIPLTVEAEPEGDRDLVADRLARFDPASTPVGPLPGPGERAPNLSVGQVLTADDPEPAIGTVLKANDGSLRRRFADGWAYLASRAPEPGGYWSRASGDWDDTARGCAPLTVLDVGNSADALGGLRHPHREGFPLNVGDQLDDESPEPPVGTFARREIRHREFIDHVRQDDGLWYRLGAPVEWPGVRWPEPTKEGPITVVEVGWGDE